MYPATYESASEAEVLRWVFSDRDGTLRNTSFGILSSDGKRKLSRTGRSPSMVYRTTEGFVDALREIADEQSTEKKKAIEALPTLPDLRVALDVAAADLRPLIVVHATKAKARLQLEDVLQRAAWSEDFIGRFRYVVVDDEELEAFDDLKLEAGISIVQAEAYGRSGEVLSHVASPKSEANLAEVLAQGLERFDSEAKRVREHLRKGEREGIEWETEIDVTDPGPRGRR